MVTLGVASVVVVADQVTKSLVQARLSRGPVHVVGPLNLSLAYNSGSAFSLFTGDAAILAVVAGVLVAVLLWAAWRSAGPGAAVALGLVLGGAVGNLVDRLFREHHGGVVDFISLPYWPTFNVADTCIVLGILTFLVLQFRRPPQGA